MKESSKSRSRSKSRQITEYMEPVNIGRVSLDEVKEDFNEYLSSQDSVMA